MGTSTPFVTFGSAAPFSLSCATIMSLRSIIFNPSQGRTTLLTKVKKINKCIHFHSCMN